MRVLLITDWPRLQGGAEAHLLALRDGLEQQGDEVRLLVSGISPKARETADRTFFASENLAARATLQYVNPFAITALRSILQNFQADIILVNMFALYLSPGALLAVGETPFVILVSDFKCICPLGHRLLPDRTVCSDKPGIACFKNRCLSLPHWLREQPRYALIRKVYLKARAVISVSKHLHDTLQRNDIPSECLPLFSPLPSADYRRARAASPLFLYLGRLEIEKGVDTLIRATALARERCPAIRLRIVGQGALLEELQQLSTRLGQGDAISFLGWKEPVGVEAELSQAWAMVAPSRWPEPFGLVALEAIQRGVPVIATAGGGLEEQVEDGQSGLLFPIDDQPALADRMIKVAEGWIFKSGTLEPAIVEKVRQRFDKAAHLSKLRTILAMAAAKPV